MNGTPGDDAGTEPVVPIDSIPGPVAGYSVGDAEPILEHTNQSFDAAFGESDPDTDLREWWDHTDLTATGLSVEELSATLAAGDAVDVRVSREAGDGDDGPRTYRLRSNSRAASGGALDGYLHFTELPAACVEAAEADRIASVISHELRNPLDVAKAHLTAARERGDEEHFEQLADAHDRMEQIVDDVLTLARKDDAISPAPGIELASVASDAWATVDTGSASLTVDAELPTMEADRDRLQRLFENLFRNSVEHARPTGNTASDTGDADTASDLEVHVGSTGQDGFFVADDGVGIPAVARRRAFEPGYSSGDSGVGLGLAIVERIAEAHGWSVSLGAGTSGGARVEFSGVESPG